MRHLFLNLTVLFIGLFTYEKAFSMDLIRCEVIDLITNDYDQKQDTSSLGVAYFAKQGSPSTTGQSLELSIPANGKNGNGSPVRAVKLEYNSVSNILNLVITYVDYKNNFRTAVSVQTINLGEIYLSQVDKQIVSDGMVSSWGGGKYNKIQNYYSKVYLECRSNSSPSSLEDVMSKILKLEQRVYELENRQPTTIYQNQDPRSDGSIGGFHR